MSCFEEMSDFEVNRAVACCLDGNELDICGRPLFKPDCYYAVPGAAGVEWHRVGADSSQMFDPCTNPSDAWPIILKNHIWIQPDMIGDGLWHCYDLESDFAAKHSNPLRAAMIVFLMMQDVQ